MESADLCAPNHVDQAGVHDALKWMATPFEIRSACGLGHKEAIKIQSCSQLNGEMMPKRFGKKLRTHRKGGSSVCFKTVKSCLTAFFPPELRQFDLKSVRIPASNRLAQQKNLSQAGTTPVLKQTLEALKASCGQKIETAAAGAERSGLFCRKENHGLCPWDKTAMPPG